MSQKHEEFRSKKQNQPVRLPKPWGNWAWPIARTVMQLGGVLWPHHDDLHLVMQAIVVVGDLAMRWATRRNQR